MAKIALKKCSFWQKLHFLGAKLAIFEWARLFWSTRSTRREGWTTSFFETIFLRLLFGDSLYGWGESVWACCCCWDFWAASFFL